MIESNYEKKDPSPDSDSLGLQRVRIWAGKASGSALPFPPRLSCGCLCSWIGDNSRDCFIYHSEPSLEVEKHISFPLPFPHPTERGGTAKPSLWGPLVSTITLRSGRSVLWRCPNWRWSSSRETAASYSFLEMGWKEDMFLVQKSNKEF